MAKKNKKSNVVERWNDYFQTDALQNWQRLMTDLGFQEEFRSKTQCRNALRKVWTNIYDFLDAVKAGTPAPKFATEAKLSRYTMKTRKMYRRNTSKRQPPGKFDGTYFSVIDG
ncbi:hypothetical protein PG988_008682 [Apiospora saccharicola]